MRALDLGKLTLYNQSIDSTRFNSLMPAQPHTSPLARVCNRKQLEEGSSYFFCPSKARPAASFLNYE